MTLHDLSLFAPPSGPCIAANPAADRVSSNVAAAPPALRRGERIGDPGANSIAAWFERRLVDRFLAVSNAIAVGSGLRGGPTPFEVTPNFVRDDVAVLDRGEDERLEGLPKQPFILFVGDLAGSRASKCSSGHTLNWTMCRPWS